MNGILVVTDAVDGVHLIDVTGRSAKYVEEAVTTLGRFFAASADGTRCWLSGHEDVFVDELPGEIKVWPGFTAFFHQFGAEWAELEDEPEDDPEEDA